MSPAEKSSKRPCYGRSDPLCDITALASGLSCSHIFLTSGTGFVEARQSGAATPVVPIRTPSPFSSVRGAPVPPIACVPAAETGIPPGAGRSATTRWNARTRATASGGERPGLDTRACRGPRCRDPQRLVGVLRSAHPDWAFETNLKGSGRTVHRASRGRRPTRTSFTYRRPTSAASTGSMPEGAPYPPWTGRRIRGCPRRSRARGDGFTPAETLRRLLGRRAEHGKEVTRSRRPRRPREEWVRSRLVDYSRTRLREPRLDRRHPAPPRPAERAAGRDVGGIADTDAVRRAPGDHRGAEASVPRLDRRLQDGGPADRPYGRGLLPSSQDFRTACSIAFRKWTSWSIRSWRSPGAPAPVAKRQSPVCARELGREQPLPIHRMLQNGEEFFTAPSPMPRTYASGAMCGCHLELSR
jgi:hypothetical protein